MRFTKVLSLAFIVFLTLLSFTLSNPHNANKQAEVKWLSFEEAVKRNQTEPRKVFIDIYTDWCTGCKVMDKSTFKDPEIAYYLNNKFYPVKLNAEMRKSLNFKNMEFYYDNGLGNVHELAYYLSRGRLSFPSLVVLDEGMNNPQPIYGFQPAEDMTKFLKYFGEDFYKKMDWFTFNLEYTKIQTKKPSNSLPMPSSPIERQ